MKDKSKILLIAAIIIVTAIIAYVCYGIFKGNKNPIATMEVSYIDSEGNEKTGVVKIELDTKNAPNTVKNFIALANNGFYDNLTFHRIMPDFMIQGGDKEGNGSGNAKLSDVDKKIEANSSNDYRYSIKGEFPNNGINNARKFEKGTIAMARSDFSSVGLNEEGYNSGSSQFFIVNTDNKDVLNSLNRNYAPFGKVIEGYEIIEALTNVKLKDAEEGEEKSTPENAPVIKSIKIDTFGAKYELPTVLNFDEINEKVMQYQQLYSQLMNQNNTDASVETSEEPAEE